MSPDSLEAWLSANTVIDDGAATTLPRIDANEKTQMNANRAQEQGKNALLNRMQVMLKTTIPFADFKLFISEY
jgi:hypothetical protein